MLGLVILRSLEGALALAMAVCTGPGAVWFAFPLASRPEDRGRGLTALAAFA